MELVKSTCVEWASYNCQEMFLLWTIFVFFVSSPSLSPTWWPWCIYVEGSYPNARIKKYVKVSTPWSRKRREWKCVGCESWKKSPCVCVCVCVFSYECLLVVTLLIFMCPVSGCALILYQFYPIQRLIVRRIFHVLFQCFLFFLSFWEIIFFAIDWSGILELACPENVYFQIVENLISQF